MDVIKSNNQLLIIVSPLWFANLRYSIAVQLKPTLKHQKFLGLLLHMH